MGVSVRTRGNKLKGVKVEESGGGYGRIKGKRKCRRRLGECKRYYWGLIGSRE